MHLLSGKGGVQITQPKIFWHDTVLFPFINDTDKFTRHQNSIGPLGTVSHQYIMLSIAAVHCIRTAVRLCILCMCKTSCLYQLCYKSKDTDNMNQQIS